MDVCVCVWMCVCPCVCLYGYEVFRVKLSVKGGLFEFDVEAFEDIEGLLVPGGADDAEAVWVDFVVLKSCVLADC